MFTHAEMWLGIDRLARHHGLTPSGLARRAGLDPTTFNPSKRITKQAKPRWPSTESLAKILEATETPFADFVAMIAGDSVEPAQPSPPRIRSVSLDQLTKDGLFDEAGFPIGDQWDEVDLPVVDDRFSYALEIRGDAMLPVYRDGDFLIISPTAGIRRRDRVILKQQFGTVQAGALLRRTAQRVELATFGEQGEVAFPLREVAWLARIVWASQ